MAQAVQARDVKMRCTGLRREVVWIPHSLIYHRRALISTPGRQRIYHISEPDTDSFR